MLIIQRFKNNDQIITYVQTFLAYTKIKTVKHQLTGFDCWKIWKKLSAKNGAPETPYEYLHCFRLKPKIVASFWDLILEFHFQFRTQYHPKWFSSKIYLDSIFTCICWIALNLPNGEYFASDISTTSEVEKKWKIELVERGIEAKMKFLVFVEVNNSAQKAVSAPFFRNEVEFWKIFFPFDTDWNFAILFFFQNLTHLRQIEKIFTCEPVTLDNQVAFF